jgi:hypothetical protein
MERDKRERVIRVVDAMTIVSTITFSDPSPTKGEGSKKIY